MRIAAVADVHGNFAALEAVALDIADQGVDLVVNLGDIASGPLQPRRTVEWLMQRGWKTIRGNCDRTLTSAKRTKMDESDAFAADELLPEQLAWLKSLPASMRLPGEVLLCHGTPYSDTTYLLEDVRPTGCTPAEEDLIKARLGGCNASLILCGHTHLPRSIQISDGRHIVNPGSVGLPAYAADKPYPHVMESGSPQAKYAIVGRIGEEWVVEFRAVDYDWDAAAELAAQRGRPDWEFSLRTGRAAHEEVS